MNNKPCILFCGSVLTFEGLKKYKGETPAASIWIKGLLDGVLANDIDVTCFSPIWDSLFPKGKLYPGKKKYLDPDIHQIPVKYINFPFLRTFSVAYSLEKHIIKALKKGNNSIAILNYNTYPYYCKALKKVSKKYPNIPWVNLVLDLDDPTKDNWNKFKTDTQGSTASVFLSWWGFVNAPIKNKLHLDGGWSGGFQKCIPTDKKTFVYAGKFATFGGIQDILDAIKLYPDNDVVFQLYGKDYYKPLIDLAENDKRVKICGFVSDDELNKACLNATAFLSPRELDFQGTRMIFPSKILFYLKYQKPIISALLPGLSPDYNDVLISPITDTPTGWMQTMKRVIEFSDIELLQITEKSKTLLKQKEWKNQAASLLKFIENLNTNNKTLE